MYPGSPPQGIPDSELRVWKALSELDDAWTAFHGVSWIGERNGKIGEGEGDFVLVHPEYGLLFLEVKGGRAFELNDGRWFRLEGSRSTPIANPFEQARSTEHEITRRVRALGIQGFRFGHAVVFPHLTHVDGLGIDAPRSITIARTQLAAFDLAIDELVEYWDLSRGFTSNDIKDLKNLFAPTVRLMPTLNDELVLVRQKIEAWTREQMFVLDALSRNHRVLVRGGAGTGKSLLAMEKARRLAAEGEDVLLVCHNAPLAGWMASELRDTHRVRVSHFAGLVRDLAGEALLTDPGGDSEERYAFPEDPPGEWYDGEAADLLVSAASVVGYRVDSVIVDEAQDFSPSHWVALELLLRDSAKGNIDVFMDRHQALYRDDWESPFDGLSYDLLKNCRNTQPIAEAVARVMDEAGEPSGVHGPEPTFISAVNIEGARKKLKRLLDEVINKGKVPARDVVILSTDLDNVTALAGTSIAGLNLSRARSADGVRVDTVHRYKGLEAEVVILLFLQEPQTMPRRPAFLSRYQQMLAYVGMSRARSRLFVVAPQNMADALRIEGSV